MFMMAIINMRMKMIMAPVIMMTMIIMIRMVIVMVTRTDDEK